MGIEGPKAVSREWYALHVRSQYERKVRDALTQSDVESYLPLYLKRVVWSDRTKDAERPLFPGYVFGHFDLADRREILRIIGVVRILGDGTHSLAVPDNEIEAVKQLVDSKLELTPMAVVVGQRIIIACGSLKGVEGVVTRLKKGKSRVVVSIPLLGRSVAAEIDTAEVLPRN
jgi:transcriptional antiterminator RfaH